MSLLIHRQCWRFCAKSKSNQKQYIRCVLINVFKFLCLSYFSLSSFFCLSLTVWLVEINVGVLSPISTDLLCFGGGWLHRRWVWWVWVCVWGWVCDWCGGSGGGLQWWWVLMMVEVGVAMVVVKGWVVGDWWWWRWGLPWVGKGWVVGDWWWWSWGFLW